MTTSRFYCAELAPGLITLDAGESRHALHSLRLRPGDEIIVFDGRGRVAHGTLRSDDVAGSPKPGRRVGVKARRAVVEVEHVLCEPPPSRTLTLIVPGCKGARLTWMVEKLTELGTTRITVANFERSVVRVGPAHARRLRRTAIEAAKQSQRVWLPEIACGAPLDKALADLPHAKLLVAHPAEGAATLFGRFHAHELADEHVTAIIGPEGGLSDAEVAMLREADGKLVRLASTILRVETAAISLAANWAAHQPR